jgi:hypothetical protein
MFLKREFHSFSLRRKFKSSLTAHLALSYSLTLCYTSDLSSYFLLPFSGLLPLTTTCFRLPLGIQQIRCILQSLLTHRNFLLSTTHSNLFTSSLFLFRNAFDFRLITCKYVSNYTPCYYCLSLSFVTTQV